MLWIVAAYSGRTAQVSWLGLRVGSHLIFRIHSSYATGELLQCVQP